MPPLPPGRLCPITTDGRHALRVWEERRVNLGVVGGSRSGFACIRCSKTWEWMGDELEETWEIWRRRAALTEMVRLDEELGLYDEEE